MLLEEHSEVYMQRRNTHLVVAIFLLKSPSNLSNSLIKGIDLCATSCISGMSCKWACTLLSF